MIAIENVSKWYGKLRVLDGVSLEVAAGEVVVICGPSGSGKSTLLRCINRLEPVQAGEIVVDGKNVGDPRLDTSRFRAEIGMVFQQFNLYPHMTALDNITLAPLKVRRMTAAEAARV